MGTLGHIWLTSDGQLERLLDGTDNLGCVCYGAYKDRDDRILDLGKTWRLLHFLLTGTARDGLPPLNFILSGGRGVELQVDRDAAYDILCARAFSSDLLPEICKALEELDPAEVKRRFDGRRLVGGLLGWEKCDDELLPDLLEQLREVRSHLQVGVQHRLGMLNWLE